jgi:DNA-directed RNA polymerase subunit M/transcription elongation factor TFIIS
MEFCEICDNLLYMRAEEDEAGNNALLKYCKHCDFSKKVTSGQSVKVSETLYSEDQLLYDQFQNKYLRYDPTLPRVRDPALTCPNAACTGPKEKPQIIYIKYQAVNMRYMYCCDYCGHVFKAPSTST